MSHANPHGQVLDIYPAGAADSHAHHGHTIISGTTLIMVLSALLFFTLLTVGASYAEAWLADLLNIVIPQWINVLVALSIAVVKTALVVLFFMGLKYDNPLNGMIFIFTIVTVACFLGFTLVDLGNRGSIDRIKGTYVTPGGSGGIKTPGGATTEGPITQWAKTGAANAAASGAHGTDTHLETQTDTHAELHDDGVPHASSPEASRPVHGVTLPGFAPPPAAPKDPAEGEPHTPEPAPQHPSKPGNPDGH
ncbi:MAG: cytochrome C oxidase subunit IV family protein [Phycisphaerales bacterium]|nr:cytochrome C oxidase subunit IV family protein [Phycisphaerales bacterium]